MEGLIIVGMLTELLLSGRSGEQRLGFQILLSREGHFRKFGVFVRKRGVDVVCRGMREGSRISGASGRGKGR